MFSPTQAPSQTDAPFDINVKLNSSALSQAWYRYSDSTLAVQSRDGNVYQYPNVPSSEWDRLRFEASPGRVWADIRANSGLKSSRRASAPEVAQKPTLPPANRAGGGWNAVVRVEGTFAMESSADSLAEAVEEFNTFLARRFEDADLNVTIERVERK